MLTCAFLRWLPVSFCFMAAGASAQDAQKEPSPWAFAADANFYFIPNDFFVLPVFKADKAHLHLEARYNYEERETVSVWAGYNFAGGKKLEFMLTPMLGGVAGYAKGIAPGLEATLTLNKFELYSESEYMFDFNDREGNFLYTWTDITYSATEWLWVGLSAQRTRLYKTDLDIQRGLLVGASFRKWEATTYLYNLGFDDPFLLVTLSFGF